MEYKIKERNQPKNKMNNIQKRKISPQRDEGCRVGVSINNKVDKIHTSN